MAWPAGRMQRSVWPLYERCTNRLCPPQYECFLGASDRIAEPEFRFLRAVAELSARGRGERAQFVSSRWGVRAVASLIAVLQRSR
jgi:hypothetical protein